MVALVFRSQVGYRPDWPTASFAITEPPAVGISASGLAAADAYAANNATHALLIMRQGRLIFEKYYSGNTTATAFNGYSIAKTLTSLAVGAAIKNGAIGSAQDKVADYIGPAPNNPHFGKMTVAHLLSMQSGLPYNYNAMAATNDWAAYLLAQALVTEPGEHWRYKADPTLVSAIIEEATGETLEDYFKSEIGAPLGLSDFRWDADPSGTTDGNGGAHLTARDMLKIGFLMLNDGLWEGERVLASHYMDEATAPCRSSSRQGADIWAASDVAITNPPMEYGYLLVCRKFSGVPDDAYFAFGGVGQFIVVIPSLDMVVVRTGNNTAGSDSTILPALLQKIVAATIH